MNKLFEQLLKKRKIEPDFLHPDYEKLSSPTNLPDIKKAVERIKKAIQESEKILIYGDYDVDGVTSSTLMEEALVLSGVKPENIEIMLPDRFADGYGMSPKLIKRAEKSKTTLVITVDCGSRNHEIIDELNTLKIDTIVTDHHECGETLPAALAIINPKRQDIDLKEPSLRELAGVGVAFKLAQALTEEKLIKEGQEKWLLDLVLIGTICDSMLLVGENRILCFYGAKVLEKTRRKGLKELLKKAGVKTINSESVGFQIGPRLNAAGRLETANLSLELLRTKSATEAATLSERLEVLNKKRRTEQTAATDEISKRGVMDTPVIIETGKWHEGILGIVAGRLVEKYQKPAFVLTEVENGIFKGSGRSFGDFSLAEALNAAKDTIISGGGHAGAAGVRVDGKNLYAFREKINDYYNSLNLKDQTSFLSISPDLDVENVTDFSIELIDDLKTLEPFGAGNEEPIFCIKNAKIVSIHRMGADGKHLRMDIKDSHNNPFKLVAFFAPDSWFSLDTEVSHDLCIKVTLNDFQGVRSVEGRLIDVD